MENIQERIARPDSLLKDTLIQLDSKKEAARADFEEWANGFGEYSLSTLYITMVYFARAFKIRSERPYVRLGENDDSQLTKKLNEVRKSFAGDYGIWEVIQDSLGGYVGER
jgi:hypothetical protein